jgi:glycerophosphoryl diester phosphodiesterase
VRGLRPIVIAHRGASGHRPEHTLAAYRLAIDLGADFIEPDLVVTKDGALVARHENEIGATTDVAGHPEFAARRTTKIVDGARITGWFSEDFTLPELKMLRAKERLPELRPGNCAYDGQEEIPTLDEVLDLARGAGNGRRIGVYPETKHPTYFRGLGLALEERLIETLHGRGYRGRDAPIYVQSFEVGNLRVLRSQTDLPLIQLLDETGRPYDFTLSGDPRTYADLATAPGLAEIARYADGVGVAKNLIVPRRPDGHLLPATRLVADAHAAGLRVHAWTFRSENHFLPVDFRLGDASDPFFPRGRGDAVAEYRLFFDLDVDGVFSDHPDDAAAAREHWAGMLDL